MIDRRDGITGDGYAEEVTDTLATGTGCREAPAAQGSVGVHDDLGWALATVLRSYLRASDDMLADLPGGARGYRLLTSVARDCPRSQLALAQHVGLDRTVVTYLLDDLANAGLLERQADPCDRRTRRVVATEAGRRRLVELDALLLRVEEHVLADLDPADSHLFRGLVQRVAVGISEREQASLTCAGVPALNEVASVTG